MDVCYYTVTLRVWVHVARALGDLVTVELPKG